MPLESFFAAHPRVAVAFSGGVDSAYLLYAAKTAGCDAAAYFLKTPFQPRFELEDAQKLAGQFGVPLHIVEYDVLGVPGVAENGPLRCYHCKRALFTRLWEAARADGFEVLCDGTNASDDGSDRPGMKALASVIGGLCDCPVIAVPTSIGYGANFGGLSALLSMLNSCASGVSVVNIDNGFGAGYLASMINHMGGTKS